MGELGFSGFVSLTELIALLALVTAVVSITYTIGVDRRRPRIEVTANLSEMYHFGSTTKVLSEGPYFCVFATNCGPGRAFAKCVYLGYRSRYKRWYLGRLRQKPIKGAVIQALSESPDQLPKWLDVGETVTLVYSVQKGPLQLAHKYDCLYVLDSLGREHWAQKRVLKTAVRQLEAN